MLLRIVLLCILIIINGIFSASELAFLSVDKIKLMKEIDKKNKKAMKINKIFLLKSIF